LNIFTLLLIYDETIGIQLILPGSQTMTLSYIFYVFLIISPSLSIVLFVWNYKSINNFSREKLNEIIKPLPKNIQIKIIENLKALNIKIKEQFKSE
ncbi:MAG: hypothetical protein ACFFDN_50035, partial [Candidatus Hodarchaeota archaeon]